MRRLDPHQPVSVSLPMRFGHDDVLDFQVVVVIDSVVVLEPLERSRKLVVSDGVSNCFITFAHKHGLVGLKGHLYQHTPGDWRFNVTDPMSRPGESDPRLAIRIPITIAPSQPDGSEEALETETLMLGTDGVLIDVPNGWCSPRHVSLTLSLLGEDEPIRTPARPIAHHGALHDFKYEGINAQARDRLSRFIVQCQRYLLRQR
jgi:hypothetical protein